ncbi:S1C family serine protease [Parablautia intestinalis]|jgi:serine protease Do|uniref:S1C family serine protease n=1 Tax=Parablautia intestinalis TaxID=2320100 RepID=UPI00256EA965|nr:trypsin-like peptidase domain-containing protein [Parablautia intestinalis]MCI8615038.1 PDZ domain-containing protein [Lachnospiraceae bacterium]
MYENNYPNNYNDGTQNGNDTNYRQQSNDTYHYGSGGSFSGADGFHREEYRPGGNNKPGREKKSGNGVGKKVAVGVLCGLSFGIFAGLGFQAVDTATDFLKDKAGIEQSREEDNVSQVEQTQAQPQEDNTAKAESSNKIDETQMVQTSVTDVTQVVKEVMPSVVSVNKKYIEKMSFWGQEYSQEGSGSGSGIIVGQNDTELLLVSNYHVVESPEELTVQFVDGTQAQAQIKGMDADKDLAVIAVQLSDISGDTMEQISIARMGNSDALSLGESVIAIGNALGYGQSVTTGVVSALDRPIAASTVQTNVQEDTEINTFIQTNAAINPGNSGGALLNMRGEVIGITSNKIGGNAVEGMGYAIPISDAEPIIEKLMTRETRLKVDEEKKGYLGITGLDVASEYSQLYDAPRGVYVSSVTEGSGADEAGLVRGDIITAIDDEEITSMTELRDYLDYCEAGSTVTLTIMQGSPLGYQSKQVEVTLGLQNNVQ